MEPTKEERYIFEYWDRYQQVAGMLKWDAKMRLIGQKLLSVDREKSWSATSIAEGTQLSRTTVINKLSMLQRLGLVHKTKSARWMHTKVGRDYHLRTHRAINALITGRADRFDPKLLAEFRNRFGASAAQYGKLEKTRFSPLPAPIPA